MDTEHLEMEHKPIIKRTFQEPTIAQKTLYWQLTFRRGILASQETHTLSCPTNWTLYELIHC